MTQINYLKSKNICGNKRFTQKQLVSHYITLIYEQITLSKI